jgi:integrase
MASFYVRKSGSSKWIAVVQEYTHGKKTQRALTEEEYLVHGINRLWSIEEARQQIRRVNQSNKIEKRQKTRAAYRAHIQKVQTSLYIDEAVATKFVNEYLIENILSGDFERAEKNKILSHWQAVQKILSVVQLQPKDYGQNAGRFLNQFKKKAFSPDYCIKLLKIVNHYGEFCCQFHNQYYKPVKFNRNQIQQIRDTYRLSRSYRGASDGLTPELLESKRALLSEENYRWLYVSVWLGLRPAEIRAIHDPKFGYKAGYDRKNKVRFVQIYQAKLKSVAEEKRWKFIPIVVEEQECIEEYLKLPLKQPSNKVLRKVFGMSTRGYAGRKNFTDLMLERGFSIEEVSAWLGHASIETTWKFYKAKDRLTLLRKKA